MKKRNALIALLSLLCWMSEGCTKPANYDCHSLFPGYGDSIAPRSCSISWTDFNPLSDVLIYFTNHWSTIAEHIGDTIKFYGYTSQVEPPHIGYYGFRLSGQSDGGWMYCYPFLGVGCAENEPVAEWMTTPGTLVYVEGVISTPLPEPNKIQVYAIHIDSVKFK